MRVALFALFALFLGCLSCSSPSGGGGGGAYLVPVDGTGFNSDSGQGGACVPGVTQVCLCAPKVEGVQSCRDDGKGWKACDCGGDQDSAAGNPDGQGADSGSTDLADAGNLDIDDSGNGEPDSSSEPDVVSEPDGEDQDWSNYFDDVVDSGPTTKPDSGPIGQDCIARAKIIYVVSEQNFLLSFDPDTMKLKKVGALNCASAGTPFSMAVDRNATAWVLYRPNFMGAGSLFEVSTLDAKCKSTTFQPGQNGLELFGMGFSADAANSADETLYIAGLGYSTFESNYNKLASVAFPSMKVTTVGTINVKSGADLTGNGLGQLFGFFPNTSPPSVREIDKSSGMTGKTYNLPPSSFSGTQAWAFAQWGGAYYLFFKSVSDASTNIWQLDAKTGAVKVVMANIGYTITGAGVSSCAPSSKP